MSKIDSSMNVKTIKKFKNVTKIADRVDQAI